MIKKWYVCVVGSVTRKTFFGKMKEWFGHDLSFMIMAETEEEAIQKAKEEYNQLQISIESCLRFHHVLSVESWDNWTIDQAMCRLNGEEFAEYAKQQGLTSLFK